MMRRRGLDVGAIRLRLADADEVCAALGLTDGAKRQRDGIIIRCPVHDDRTPSCSVRTAADGTLYWRCFACGAAGDVLHLIAHVRGLDVRREFGRVLAEAARIAGMHVEAGR
jgi:DNA primase